MSWDWAAVASTPLKMKAAALGWSAGPCHQPSTTDVHVAFAEWCPCQPSWLLAQVELFMPRQQQQRSGSWSKEAVAGQVFRQDPLDVDAGGFGVTFPSSQLLAWDAAARQGTAGPQPRRQHRRCRGELRCYARLPEGTRRELFIFKAFPTPAFILTLLGGPHYRRPQLRIPEEPGFGQAQQCFAGAG